MKKFLFLLLFSPLLFAQEGMFSKDPIINKNWNKQRVHWGYYLGFNSLDFKFDYLSVTEDIEVGTTTGFNVGLIGNLRLAEYFDLRFEPGLYITQRNLTYPNITDNVDRLREVKSTYFSSFIKIFCFTYRNVRPYLLGGVSTAMNLSSNANSPDDNLNNRFRMTKWTNFYEVGFGIDLYLEYFIFSPSIRGVFSMNDELIRDNDPNSLGLEMFKR